MRWEKEAMIRHTALPRKRRLGAGRAVRVVGVRGGGEAGGGWGGFQGGEEGKGPKSELKTPPFIFFSALAISCSASSSAIFLARLIPAGADVSVLQG